MSTSPSTPEREVDYTVVGGGGGDPGPMPALVVLKRGTRHAREEFFRSVQAAGYREIISVEPREHSYSVEALTRDHPGIRFVLLNRELNVGYRINLAARLVRSSHFLLIWSTIAPPTGLSVVREQLDRLGDPCIAPTIRTENGETLPVVQAPARQGSSLRVLSLPMRATEADTIYPFDFVALYDTRAFEDLGGYDPLIESAHWQKLDFGFRTYLSGRRIRVSPSFRVIYRGTPEPEDRTIDRSYVRFFARNLAFRHDRRGTRLPLVQVVEFALRARIGIAEAIRIYRDAARWIESRKQQIRRDPADIVSDWSADHAT